MKLTWQRERRIEAVRCSSKKKLVCVREKLENNEGVLIVLNTSSEL